MGIVMSLRGSLLPPAIWPADEVLVRFDASGVSDVRLMKRGKNIGPKGIRGDNLDSAESSDEHEFAVVLLDKDGFELGPYAARWLEMRYPPDDFVVFGDEPNGTDAGLSGDVMTAKVAPTGRVEVQKLHVGRLD